MRVLVTGGTGFIGSHSVAALLSQGHQVRLLVRSRERVARSLSPLGVAADVEPVLGDVTAPGSVAKAMAGCDALLHAAAVYSFDARAAARIRDVNVRGTEIVLGAAVRAGLDPVVHVSSYVALLPPGDAVLTPDSLVKRPQGAYSRSKADSERVARRYQEQGAPVVITYPGAVIGPHDPYLGESNRNIIAFATSGLAMREGGVPWVDVRDVAKVHAAVMEPGRGPRRYMITGQYIALTDLTAMLHEITGHRGRIVALPAGAAEALGRMADLMQHITPGRLHFSHEAMWICALQAHCDDSRTVKELGITPRDLRETLADTVRWLAGEGHISLARAQEAA